MRKRITDAAVEPITAAAFRLHARLDDVDTDAEVLRFVTAARRAVETDLDIALITQTWEITVDTVPESGFLELLPGPAQSVTSLTTYDATYQATTVTEGLDLIPTKTHLVIPEGTTVEAPRAGLTVRFVAGFGDEGDDVPGDLVHAVLLMAAHLYEVREATNPEAGGITPGAIPLGFTHLLQPYRRFRL